MDKKKPRSGYAADKQSNSEEKEARRNAEEQLSGLEDRGQWRLETDVGTATAATARGHEVDDQSHSRSPGVRGSKYRRKRVSYGNESEERDREPTTNTLKSSTRKSELDERRKGSDKKSAVGKRQDTYDNVLDQSMKSKSTSDDREPTSSKRGSRKHDDEEEEEEQNWWKRGLLARLSVANGNEFKGQRRTQKKSDTKGIIKDRTLLDSYHMVPIPEVHRFILACFKKIGVRNENSQLLAEMLVHADKRGDNYFGLFFLKYYVLEILEKRCSGRSYPSVRVNFPSFAVVDGKKSLGPVVGKFCLNLAIKKARKNGIGFVVAKNTNHCGNPSWYTQEAVKQGMIGLTFMNSPPFLKVDGSKNGKHGGNWVAFSAPGSGDESFEFKLPSASTSAEKVDYYRLMNEKVQPNTSLDSTGRPTTDASDVLDGYILPFAGYLGIGLAIAVEALTSVMVNSDISLHDNDSIQKFIWNYSHCLVVINPKCFENHFEERMSDLLKTMRKLKPVSSHEPVMVPGDFEADIERLATNENMLIYLERQVLDSTFFAKNLDVPPLKGEKKS